MIRVVYNKTEEITNVTFVEKMDKGFVCHTIGGGKVLVRTNEFNYLTVD